MRKALERFGMVAALITVGGLASTGCMVSADAGEGSVSTSYYSPMHYNGNIVYYDTAGLPIYYVGGSAVYVPSTYSHYGAYRTHYSTHRGNYNRWYGARGQRYRATGRAPARRHAQPARRGQPVRRGQPAHRGGMDHRN